MRLGASTGILTRTRAGNDQVCAGAQGKRRPLGGYVTVTPWGFHERL